ncbi:MAG TPA: M56 family metallopeptidase [Candidatus Polarisedimenticolaceae bacterium]|nr:M56 family metallopeptidase [Candidatus Polarisedimenticolaceae bacterium]
MNPVTQAVGAALLHLVWQATAIAVVLAIVLARMARGSAQARYVASGAALALVLAAFVGTALRAYDPVPVPGSGLLVTANEVVVEAAASVPDRLEVWSARLQRALPAVVALWLAGVGLLAARLLVSWSRVRRLARRGVAPRPQWEAAAARLVEALGMRRAVRLLESSAVDVPGVIGALRPVILLPASALTGLSPAEIEMLLAHELAHVRRHDYLLNLLQSVVETLFFFHPAVWWISRRVRDEREHCCDDLAVAVCGNPVQYARALTRLEELRSAPRLVAAAAGGSLLGRVRRLAGQGTEAREGAPWAAAFLLLTVLAILAFSPSLHAPARAGTTEEEAPAVPQPAAEVPVPASVNVAIPVSVPLALPALAGLKGATDRPDDPEAPARNGVRPSIDELISLKAAGVDGAYIKAMRELFPTLTLSQASSLGAVGVSPDYVRQMRGIGLRVDSPDHASSLRALGVSPEFVESMRKAGLQLTRVDEATSLAAVGVTPEYIAQMRGLGFGVRNIEEVAGLRAVGVTPEWLAAMRQAGVEVEDPSDAAGLRAVGVTPDFVRRLAKAGYANLTVSELQNLAAQGIDESFIGEMEQYRKKERDVR